MSRRVYPWFDRFMLAICSAFQRSVFYRFGWFSWYQKGKYADEWVRMGRGHTKPLFAWRPRDNRTL